jgi:hypothetical protein
MTLSYLYVRVSRKTIAAGRTNQLVGHSGHTDAHFAIAVWHVKQGWLTDCPPALFIHLQYARQMQSSVYVHISGENI